MQSFIKMPNLPSGKVTAVAISAEAKSAINALTNMGIECIKVESHPDLDSPVGSHADMLIHHLGNKNILLAKKQDKLMQILKVLRFNAKYINEDLADKYPFDCLLNAARIGNKLFCGRYISNQLSEYCEKNNVEIIRVRQGYAKCSVCVLDENTIITDDTGIDAAAKREGIDSLLISHGGIKIEKYSYGFIGGCCGKIAKNILAFNGDISKHKDYREIKAIADNCGVEVICLHDGLLTDIGGILPLIESV
ncbi:MAG TPA: hypothetical protein GXX17_05925 [Clostridiales bacterium]|nr:hypothetical protein [Clostridiales bacterium]